MRGTYVTDSYRTLMDRQSLLAGTDKLGENIMVFLADLSFGLIRLLYQFSTGVLDVVSQVNLLSGNLDALFTNALAFYQPLYTEFFPYLMAGSLLYWFWQFLLGSIQKANRFLGSFLLVILVNSALFTYGSTAVTSLQQASDEFEKIVIHSMLIPLKTINPTLEKKDMNTQKTTDLLKDFVHSELLEKTFAINNFGTYQYNDEVMGQFLVKEVDKVKLNDKLGEVDKLVEQKDSISVYLTAAKGWDKIYLTFIQLIYSFFVTVFVVGLSLGKVILQAVMLLMIILSPLMAFMSLVPKYSHVIFKFLGNFMSLFVIMPLLMLGCFVVFYMFNMVDVALFSSKLSFIDKPSLLLVSSAVKIILLWLTIRYREKIIKMLTSGQVVNVSQTPNMMASGGAMVLGAGSMAGSYLGTRLGRGMSAVKRRFSKNKSKETEDSEEDSNNLTSPDNDVPPRQSTQQQLEKPTDKWTSQDGIKISEAIKQKQMQKQNQQNRSVAQDVPEQHVQKQNVMPQQYQNHQDVSQQKQVSSIKDLKQHEDTILQLKQNELKRREEFSKRMKKRREMTGKKNA